MTNKTLGAFGLKAFEDRGISPETAVRYGIYTGRSTGKDGGVVPDENGTILAFPFHEREAVVAEKYRPPGRCQKRFSGVRYFSATTASRS